jgi:biotin carboxyl carrier protein
MVDKKELKEVDCGEKKKRCKILIIDGTKYRTFYNSKFEKRKKYELPDPNKIISYIPGTVVKLFVKEGQEVQKGESILIIDAMKMKTRLTFDTSGRVKSVNVSEGVKVPKDFLMIELEPLIR